jgi:NADPH:quinone reductase-like Zn-dependent oxidoreductase
VEPDGVHLREIAQLADDGALQPLIDSVFSLSEARPAFERVMQGGKRGKVVIRVRDD